MRLQWNLGGLTFLSDNHTEYRFLKNVDELLQGVQLSDEVPRRRPRRGQVDGRDQKTVSDFPLQNSVKEE